MTEQRPPRVRSTLTRTTGLGLDDNGFERSALVCYLRAADDISDRYPLVLFLATLLTLLGIDATVPNFRLSLHSHLHVLLFSPRNQ